MMIDNQHLKDRMSSFAIRLDKANSSNSKVNSKSQLLGVLAVIAFCILITNVAAYYVVEFGLFGGDTEFFGSAADACINGIPNDFDFGDAGKTDQWYDDTSILIVPTAGTYKGAQDIQEHMSFIASDHFGVRRKPLFESFIPVSLTKDECVVLITNVKKVNNGPDMGPSKCAETVVGFKAHYTVKPKFHIKKAYIYLSSDLLNFFGTGNNYTASEVFSEYEIDAIKNIGYENGLPKKTLYKECDLSDKIIENDDGYVLGITNSSFMSEVSPRNFMLYYGLVVWATVVLTGLGLESLVWSMFLQGDWDERKENYWKVAQFLFPLIATTSIGLAHSQNFLALPFIVVALWKFGFPETILCIHSGMYDKEQSLMVRGIEFVNGIGLALHHSAGAMYIVMLVTNILPSQRALIEVALPLVMAHWFVLLRYNYKLIYTVMLLIVEAWFEYTLFSNLEIIHQIHPVGGVMTAVMLLAHWMWLCTGILGLLSVEKDEQEDTNNNLVPIKLRRMSMAASIIQKDVIRMSMATV